MAVPRRLNIRTCLLYRIHYRPTHATRILVPCLVAKSSSPETSHKLRFSTFQFGWWKVLFLVKDMMEYKKGHPVLLLAQGTKTRNAPGMQGANVTEIKPPQPA
ncbi:predicted protein [Histoplasma capsulatum var. duboisii H88]|uniref:Predicted protein n=2 Tax=Ajellomyces capsulatus TaxID=5037 RepID=F0UGC2_AJEC8|nr:predicted protein [Histoplasma capsulatum H143]EGC44275.1 predicted protein [Histoplasma capsulatum var. duboisii H88]